MSVVTLGFALNAYASIIMGSDRSYYGHEVGGLSFKPITSFPYSIIAHPMLTGNIIAFSGTMLDTEFRENWWPLSVTHVAMNAGLLIMETKLNASSGGAQSVVVKSATVRFVIGAVALSLGAVIGYLAFDTLGPTPAIGVAIIIPAFALSLYHLYSADACTPPSTMSDMEKQHEYYDA